MMTDIVCSNKLLGGGCCPSTLASPKWHPCFQSFLLKLFIKFPAKYYIFLQHNSPLIYYWHWNNGRMECFCLFRSYLRRTSRGWIFLKNSWRRIIGCKLRYHTSRKNIIILDDSDWKLNSDHGCLCVRLRRLEV